MPEMFFNCSQGGVSGIIMGENDRAGQKGPIPPPLVTDMASFPSSPYLFSTLSLLRRLKVQLALSWESSGSFSLAPVGGQLGVPRGLQASTALSSLSKEHLGYCGLG